MGNYFFILDVWDVFVRSQRFEKAFCSAGEANIHDRVPHGTSLLGFFCTLLIIITAKRMFVQTGFVQQPLFRYRFRAICYEFGESKNCRCFVLMHNSYYKPYYIFGRITGNKCFGKIFACV